MIRFTVSILLLFFLPLSVIQAEEVTGKILEEQVDKTIEIEKETQEHIKKWSEAKGELHASLESLEEEKKAIQQRMKKLEPLLRIEERENSEYLRKKEAQKRVREELSTYLDSLLIALTAQIDRDLPFSSDERRGRLRALEELLVNPSESPAEKFRRVFEALQIEAEYGSTVDVVQKNIDIEGEKLLVDIFRLGRISLFFLTIDNKRAGYFDRVSRSWQPLPLNSAEELKKAMAIARMERSAEFVNLPLGRIVLP